MYSSKRSLYYYYYFIYLLAFNGVVVAYLDYNPGESLTECFLLSLHEILGYLCSASDVGTIQKSPFVRVTSDGMMYSYFRQRLTSTCQLNLWLFPFDLQKCTITFGSMVSDGKLHLT